MMKVLLAALVVLCAVSSLQASPADDGPLNPLDVFACLFKVLRLVAQAATQSAAALAKVSDYVSQKGGARADGLAAGWTAALQRAGAGLGADAATQCVDAAKLDDVIAGLRADVSKCGSLSESRAVVDQIQGLDFQAVLDEAKRDAGECVSLNEGLGVAKRVVCLSGLLAKYQAKAAALAGQAVDLSTSFLKGGLVADSGNAFKCIAEVAATRSKDAAQIIASTKACALLH